MVNKLIEKGVNTVVKADSDAAKPLEGLSIVVTGSLEHFTRTTIKEFIRANGGRPSSSVSAKTDILVVGEKPGSKLAKAQKLGIKVITEEELIEMTKSTSPAAAEVDNTAVKTIKKTTAEKGLFD